MVMSTLIIFKVVFAIFLPFEVSTFSYFVLDYWRRKREPTPVFLPGGSLGQNSLAGYTPWGRKQLDTTEQLALTLDYLEASH